MVPEDRCEMRLVKLTEEDLLKLPNCTVPDCPFKSSKDSDMCYPHTTGEPMPPEQSEYYVKVEE
jgi:hypothetical protein